MNGRLLVVLYLCLICVSQVNADSAGVFTYQSGSFTTISASALDTPLGIDSAGDLLMATDGNVGAPVLFSGGTFTSISVPVPGALVEGYSMSQNGTILGSYTLFTRTFFTDLNGSFSIVNLPGDPHTTGNALINDKGQILLSSFNCCNQPDFIYDIGTAGVTPISFPGATVTSLIAINNKGQILGAAGDVFFIYDAGAFTTLALPAGCSPSGINDSGEIIGNCFTAKGSNSILQGFLYKSGVLTYINYNGNSNLNNTFITNINDSGEVVGTFSDVPEASTLSQLGVGLLLFAFAAMTLRLKQLATARRLLLE